MYILKNSMKNLLRNKSRNILIFMILFATITAVTTCAIICAASERQVDDYTKSFKVGVTLDLDYQKLVKDYPGKQIKKIDGSTYYEDNTPEDVTPSQEQIENYVKSKYVDHCDMSMMAEYCTDLKTELNSAWENDDMSKYYGKDMSFFRKLIQDTYSTSCKYYLSEEFKSSTLFGSLYDSNHTVTEQEAKELAARTVFGEESYKEYLQNGLTDKLVETAFNIKYNWPNALKECMESNGILAGNLVAFLDKNTDFTKGYNSMSEGRLPENKLECAVGKEFAENNKLTIGDKISVNGRKKVDGAKPIELKITGIVSNDAYKTGANVGTADSTSIYITPETLWESKFAYDSNLSDTTFYLKNKNDLSAFEKELRANGVGTYININSNLDALDNVVEPAKKIGTFTTTLLFVILALGGIVFLLLSFLAVCERKYEIGVLRAIGMKKKHIITGFLYETAILVMLCCVIGIASGALISQPVADMMNAHSKTENSTTVSQNNSPIISTVDGTNVIDGMVDNKASSAEPMQEMSAYLTVPVILEIMAAAIFLMMVSVIIEGLYITRFEPIKILSNQE